MSRIKNRILVCSNSDAKDYIKSALKTGVIDADQVDCQVVWWAARKRTLQKLDDFGYELNYLSSLEETNNDSTISVDLTFEKWMEESLHYKRASKQRAGGSIGNIERNTILFELCEAIRLITVVKPTVILIKNGTRNLPKSLSVVARHFNIPIIYTENGPFPSSLYLSPFTVGPDICRYPAEPDNTQGLSATLTESIKEYVANYLVRPESAHQQPGFVGVEKWRKQLGLTGKEIVVAYTAQKESDANMLLYSSLFKTNAQYLEFLISALEDVENAVIIAKPHPKEKGPLQVPKVKSKVKVIVTSSINVKELFSISSVVATLNSTTGFEALLHGKPVITGADAFYNGFGFTFDVKSRDMTKELSDFLKQPEITNQQHLQFEAFLQKIIAEHIYFVSPQSGLNGPKEYVEKILSNVKEFENPIPLEYSLLADLILKERQRQQLHQPMWKRIVKKIQNRAQ